MRSTDLKTIPYSMVAWLVVTAAGVAQTKSARLEELTHPDLKTLNVQVIVLPIGSTEPHGNHLLYGNDTMTADVLAARVAEKANTMGAHVMVLPTMPYGVNSNQAPNPYAQSIRPDTLIRFVKDVVDTAEQQGVRKVVILNSHGGNTTTLGAALRELFVSNPKAFVALIEPSAIYKDQVSKIIETPGDHAAEEETSLSLALFPGKVYMQRAVKARESTLKMDSLKAPYITFIRPWKYISDTTGLGDPTRATVEKGQKLVDLFVERISKFLKELSDAKLTETFPY